MIIFKESQYEWKTSTLMEFLIEGNIPTGWDKFFCDNEELLNDISHHIAQDRTKTIYPPLKDVFRTFDMTPIDNIKVVIIGQDPYHNGSAVGLCFSVKQGNSINPSLRSIYKELETSGYPQPKKDGNLEHWAKQGVLMLNTSLTVEKSMAGSHVKQWKQFTDNVISYIDEKCGDNVDWLLFGKHACKSSEFIKKGRIHKTTHPMPLAAGNTKTGVEAFWGSGIFGRVKGINW
jgi:uracil-DNA glycosylase